MGTFELITETYGSIAIMRPRGNLFYNEAKKFEESAAILIGSGYCKFVVNLNGVRYIGSSGIGSLLWLYNRVREEEGRLICTDVPRKVVEVLQMMELSMFETMDSEEKAVAALGVGKAGN